MPEDALAAMDVGVDVIDGSYAMRACAAGCALLLRECDRGQNSRQLHSSEIAATSETAATPLATATVTRLQHAHMHGDQGAAALPSLIGVPHEPRAEDGDDAFDALETAPGLEEAAACSTGAHALQEESYAESWQSARGRTARGAAVREAPEEDVNVALRHAAAAAGPWDQDDSNICLWSERFRSDTGPLCRGCSCYTCQRHTRAYVHHLLHVREMLAQVTSVSTIGALQLSIYCPPPIVTPLGVFSL
jgi:hypothetical protein